MYSYAYWDGSGYVKIEGVEANILDTIIKLANNEMLNGDKVGTIQLSQVIHQKAQDMFGQILEHSLKTPYQHIRFQHR